MRCQYFCEKYEVPNDSKQHEGEKVKERRPGNKIKLPFSQKQHNTKQNNVRQTNNKKKRNRNNLKVNDKCL